MLACWMSRSTCSPPMGPNLPGGAVAVSRAAMSAKYSLASAMLVSWVTLPASTRVMRLGA
jgi:hypothetical protein